MAKMKTEFSGDTDPQAREPFDMSSLMTGGPEIEAIPPEVDLKKIAEEEAFMNDILEIRFVNTGDENAPRVIEVGVNTASRDGTQGGKSVKMGFIPGVKYKVPRYVFEVIAHAKRTTLEQTRDPQDPMKIMHVERHAFFYPFECLADPNPKGQAWRERVMNSPA